MESSMNTAVYAARLEIDYPAKLERLTTCFRVIWIIPIVIVLCLLTATGSGETVGGLFFVATMLMVVFRQRPTLVVRLRPRTGAFRGAGPCLPRSAHRSVPLDR
jgi:hypothetical protein